MRTILCLNKDWRFTGKDGREEAVEIPHTWNNIDGQDGGNDYYRGTCHYRKTFAMPDVDLTTQQVWLQFDGVNASASVTLNGKKIACHDGGYSTFRADITGCLQEENELDVAVDNSINDWVYPQKADFTFYGGIYRDVKLLIVNKNHFSLDYWGGIGLKVTPAVKGKNAEVRVETWYTGDGTVHVKLLDAEGREVAAGIGDNMMLDIPDVRLWNGVKDPYLYTCAATLYVDGQPVDEVRSRFGVRSFYADSNKGFFLNGQPYPLHGVSRHQDRKGLGNALLKEHHDEDMALIREMGCNTIRLAHYQHDQYFYDLCDENGMVVWAEIPYISEHMPGGRENTVTQAKELVIQNYNHPCIVVWGVSNEITISTKDKKGMMANHRELNDLYHRLDPTRLTTLACYAMCGPFNPVAHLTDVVSWNLYLGWYVPGLFLNNLWIDFFHWTYPNRALGYSEYGCEAMTNLHSSKPRRQDQTEEYQCVYHEYLLNCFAKRPFLWATHVWNMFDFAADARDQGGEPGMNHKGVVTFDRKIKKDSFYLYKAWWSDEPFVHICSKRYVDRAESTTAVKVYTNQKEVSLYVDGKLLARRTGDKVFEFKVPLHGTIRIEAVSGNLKDNATFRYVDKPNPDYILKKDSGKGKNWV